MSRDRVVIVHLRRPASASRQPREMRSDPFWEFGSFGITGCHSTNLMHPRNADSLKGVRLAFAQGGGAGTRLVYLTSAVRTVVHRHCVEALWEPANMPFRYGSAPLLVDNEGQSDFPGIQKLIADVRRSTPAAKLASKFRSGIVPLDCLVGAELIRIYSKLRKKAPESAIADCYADALPWQPPVVDRNREATYSQRLNQARRNGCR